MGKCAKKLNKKGCALIDIVVPFIQLQIPNVFAKVNDVKYNLTIHSSNF